MSALTYLNDLLFSYDSFRLNYETKIFLVIVFILTVYSGEFN